MATILESILQAGKLEKTIRYLYHDAWEVTADRRANTFALIAGGPWKVMLIVFVYLLLNLRILPEYMKNRKPFDLRKCMVTYNSVMVLLNGVGFIYGLTLTNFGRLTWACGCADDTDNSTKAWIMLYLGYFYFVSKFLDMIDTFFFVLRKKNGHLSFLHLFHHAMMPLVAYVGIKYFHYHNGFTGLFNSFIHAVMYCYYGISAMGSEYKQYTWWKRYLTQLQMVQFICVLAHALYSTLNPTCCWSKTIGVMEGTYAVIFLYLFGMFYFKSYRASKAIANRQTNIDQISEQMKKKK